MRQACQQNVVPTWRSSRCPSKALVIRYQLSVISVSVIEAPESSRDENLYCTRSSLRLLRARALRGAQRNADLFEKTLAKVLEDADVKKTEIDEIVLVGGSTRIHTRCRRCSRSYSTARSTTRASSPTRLSRTDAARHPFPTFRGLCSVIATDLVGDCCGWEHS